MTAGMLRLTDLRHMDPETRQVELEKIAGAWTDHKVSTADVMRALIDLRPDLADADGLLWDLWTDFVAAITEWRSADGWAGTLHKAVGTACDELTGRTP